MTTEPLHLSLERKEGPYFVHEINIKKTMSCEVVDAPSLEAPKARLDGALSNLV